MLTSAMLVEFCRKVYAAGWVYWYGTYGKPCTQKLYKSKRRQYPAHYTDARAAGYRRDIAAGKRCADCVGMIKAFFWTGGAFGAEPVYRSNHCPDVSANGMIRLCAETGRIDAIPEEPGLVVWKDGHIGVYIGEGWTIEMRGFNYDCVKRRVKDGPWTKWGRLPGSMLQYGAGPVPTGLSRGDYGSAVEAMQAMLLGWDGGCLPEHGVDGDFGGETEKAVKDFQQAMGLPVTGVCDDATRKALGAAAETASGGAAEKAIVEITGGTVNVRAEPGTRGRDIGDARRGDRLPYGGQTALVDGREWYRIAYRGGEGWVSGRYARRV